MKDTTSTASRSAGRDFIRQLIDEDLSRGAPDRTVVTRFPPEPNGFLHIGHAKSIVLNFGLAEEYEHARCHLRFDDTNPTTEEVRYADAIQEDVRWLGYDWGEHLYFASDYFERMYGFAQELIRKGLAFVDSQSEEEIREGRGTVTQAGRESPHRDRSVEENLDLFARMRAGDFGNGEHVLRARIDMASPNMLMRDPVLYRIRHAEHFRTGDRWCVYPLYDFAHPLEDALEGVTHSLCTLEFANNRELYDWVVENTSVPHRPRQYEFARLHLDYTVMSKRKLLRLVEAGDVSGWDDPRMPTIAGLRRRGVTPESIRAFCEMVGVARSDSRVDIGKLEFAIRDDLNARSPRVLAVLDPLRVTLTDWPEGRVEKLEAPRYPHDVPQEGTRTVPFSGHLWIDRQDFEEDPPAGFRRLVPGGEVRLRYGCVIRCEEVVRDEAGEVVELRCTHDPDTWGGAPPSDRKVKGTIQWVSASHAVPCEVRLYDRLFTVPDPEGQAGEGDEADFRRFLNPDSLSVMTGALIEPSVLSDPVDARYQFERLGYFWRDPDVGRGERPVFNRIVTLRDTWARRASSEVEGDAAPSGGRRPGGAGKEAGSERREARSGARSDVGPANPRAARPPEVEARMGLLTERFGLGPVDAEILAREPQAIDFLAAAVTARAGGSSAERPTGVEALANWMIHSLPPLQEGRTLGELPFGPEELAALADLVEEGVVSSSGAAEVLAVLAAEGGAPRDIVDRLDLAQVSDAEALAPIIAELLVAHPGKVEEYRGGKTGLLGFFMGQVMRRTGGKADPEITRELLERALG
jgi:glutaminyl-tRNA synthetase